MGGYHQGYPQNAADHAAKQVRKLAVTVDQVGAPAATEHEETQARDRGIRHYGRTTQDADGEPLFLVRITQACIQGGDPALHPLALDTTSNIQGQSFGSASLELMQYKENVHRE